jgi:serine/threonine protein kinase
VAKVCDFGVAKFMQTIASRASAAGGGGGTAGTLPWKSPETFIGQYDTASDAFAFGVTAYEVLSRKYPFEGLGEPEIIRKTQARFEVQSAMLRFGITEEQQRQGWNEDHPLSERRPDLSAVEAGCPAELVAVAERCWADEPSQRLTVAACVAELQRLQQQEQQQEPEPEPEPEPRAEPKSAANANNGKVRVILTYTPPVGSGRYNRLKQAHREGQSSGRRSSERSLEGERKLRA